MRVAGLAGVAGFSDILVDDTSRLRLFGAFSVGLGECARLVMARYPCDLSTFDVQN
jgi:hypothetical protein